MRGWVWLWVGGCGPVLTSTVEVDAADQVGHAPIVVTDFDVGTGGLTLVADTVDLSGEVLLEWNVGEPEATLEVDEEGVAFLRDTCKGPGVCSSTWTMRGPAGALRSRLGTGDVDVSGAWGPADLIAGTGSVRAAGLGGERFAVDVGTGDVEATEIGASDAVVDVGTGEVDVAFVGTQDRVQVEVGTGGVQLAFAAAPGEVEVNVGVGDVTLTLPPGRYRVETSVGVGDVDVGGITPDNAASSVISVSVGTGDVVVRATP